MKGYFDDPKVKAHIEEVWRNVSPLIDGSQFSMFLSDQRIHWRAALELGAAILFDKPLLVVVLPGQPVTAKLRLVATEVVEISGINRPADQEKIRLAIERITRRPS
jgi:hypothetical protein